MWDAFICHASDDKKDVVVPLVERLQRDRVRVWVDYKEVVAGDSLRQRIDEGLSQSRFGIVVLSSSFFNKKWPKRELDGLFALDRDTFGRLLPVWHRVSSDAVATHVPTLAGRLGIKTDEGIRNVAARLLLAIRRKDAPSDADRSLEELIAAYDAIDDRNHTTRVALKRNIRAAMATVAAQRPNVDRYSDRHSEGGRLAFGALLHHSPKASRLLSLIDTCRRTRHGFVWCEICAAIERCATLCSITKRQRAQAVAELDALRHRAMYRSGSLHEPTERALSRLRECER